MKNLILLASILLLNISFAQEINSDQSIVNQAKKLLKEEKYKEASDLYLKLANERNNAVAQYSLAEMYFKGQGVKQDYVEALKLCKQSAEQGYVLAQNQLGIIYSKGLGVKQDQTEAVKWIEKAAAK